MNINVNCVNQNSGMVNETKTHSNNLQEYAMHIVVDKSKQFKKQKQARNLQFTRNCDRQDPPNSNPNHNQNNNSNISDEI
jgi:hypothetical protein